MSGRPSEPAVTAPALPGRLLPGTPVAIALDLGGTHLKGGLVGPGGAHAHLQARDTRAAEGYASVLEGLVALAAELRALAEGEGLSVAGIGIGAPGPLDRARGVVEFAPNLGWHEVPLRDDMARCTGIERVRLENDANAATFAEAWVGQSSGARCLLGLTLGTGIGGGLVIGGRLFAGAHGLAGELGHVVVDPRGRACRCGGRGCLEAHFSGWALVEGYRERTRAGRPGAVHLDDLSPEDVFEAWSRGDPDAAAVVDEGLDAFGRALAGAVNLLNPDRIVLFGGLAGSWDLFGPPLLERVRRLALQPSFEAVRFHASRLAWAGVLGAGGLLLSESADL
ncbi:MAG: ROK family protein [Gemmatimonadota bacterium]